MNDCEEFAPRMAGRKAAVKALAGLRDPYPMGTDKSRLWRQGAADILRATIVSWEREQDRTPGVGTVQKLGNGDENGMTSLAEAG